jgi:CIC family chloride channel protein
VTPPAPKTLLYTRAAGRRFASRAGSHINSMSYLVRWLILASVIGVVAGLGAIVFFEALQLSTQFFLSFIAGYHVPTPGGEGNLAGSAHYVRAWAIPLVVVLGGLLSGFLVFTLAPEAEGHGTDAAIDAVHYNPRGIRLRAVVVKIIASALTIGSGGSGGREGPTAQISAGFGSLLARVLDLSPEDGRIAVSVGIGSGIGAIFSAPLGGAVLAADVIYREDFEYTALIPGVFASVIAYAVFGAVFGYQPLFSMPGYRFDQPIQLLWFGVIGLLAGAIGLLYAKGFYGIVKLSHRMPFSRKLRPAVGGLFVGLIALALPQVLGTGYGWVQKALSNDLLHTPLWIILLLPFARIAATAFSIGSGGSGGVFGPGMVIGAFSGLAVWRILAPFAPGVGHDPAPFVVVGMMAVFGGISRAPLAVMLMVGEMTGSIQILAPALVAVALATFVVTRFDDSIYRSQLRTRADSGASRFKFGMPLLTLIHVSDTLTPPRVVVSEGESAAQVLEALHEAEVPGAPVVDKEGYYLGAVSRPALEDAADEDPEAEATSVLDSTATTISDGARMDVALEALTQAGGHWVTVTANRRVVGILAISDVIRGYQQMLLANAGQIAEVSENALSLEERVGGDSRLAGRTLAEVAMPSGSIVISIQRGEHMIFASGSTRLEQGDLVSVLASPDSAEETRQLIRGSEEPEPPMVERGSQMV